MNYDFAFDLSDLPSAVINLLCDWSVFVSVRDYLMESNSATEALELLTDYGYLDEDLSWS